MKKLLFIILFFVAAFHSAWAQQDAMFTHYMFNTQAVNPGYAGSRDALTITGLHRSMWAGFNGAPTTQTLTMHTPVFDENFGMGMSVLNDKIGPTNLTSFSLDLAYRFKVSSKAKLAFGIKPSVGIRSVNLTALALETEGDNAFSANVNNQIIGNVGAGLYFYTPTFYTGISAPGILENKLDVTDGISQIAKYQRHYFYIIGGVMKMSNKVKFKPTALVKATAEAPVEADLTASFLFNDKFWMGAMFRTGDAVGALLGINITDQFSIGYSFDWSYANQTMKYNGGSHELMLRYDFIYHTQKQIISPRYF